jgi:hypothetical protein
MLIKELQTGDILLYEKDKVVSKTIQILTKCKYGHCGTVIRVGKNIFVFEAIEMGYRCRLLEETLLDCIGIVVKRPTFEFDKELLYKWHSSKLGERYDYEGTVFQQLTLTLFGWYVGQTGDKTLFCSEAALRGLNIASNNNYFQDSQKAPSDLLYNFTDFSTYDLNKESYDKV